MTKWQVLIFLIFSCRALAAFSNYNGVLVGERAAGMGGAGTALTDDASAAAYYNPATLARLTGRSLSANTTLFNKYDSTYGSEQSLDSSLFRINKGAILTVPASSGIFSSFHNFSVGLSIIVPEYQNFGGTISDSGTFLHVENQSLWVGGAMGLNLNDHDAVGMTAYYTSQTFTRSLSSRYMSGSGTQSDLENSTFTTNSIIYQLGYFHEFNEHWQAGAAYRFRSIPVNGSASYQSSSVNSGGAAPTPVMNTNLKARADVPDRLGLGVVYTNPKTQTYSFDVNWYDSNSFQDFDQYGDVINQKTLVNFAFGFENYIEPWLALRLGVFTDLAASPKVPTGPLDRRYQDHIDKYGFSANFGIKTTEHTTVDLGGYYVGGTGFSSELIDGSYQRLSKSEYLFSFLVGSSYVF